MLTDLLKISKRNLLITGERKSGKTLLAFYFASKLNRTKIIYFFSNIYNLINYIDNVDQKINISFKEFYKLNDLIEIIFKKNNIDHDNSVFIFDDLSILNLEITNIIEYYINFNSLLCYLSLLTQKKEHTNIFITNKDDEILNKVFIYWCDYILETNKEDENLKISFKDEKKIKTTILNIKSLKPWN